MKDQVLKENNFFNLIIFIETTTLF